MNYDLGPYLGDGPVPYPVLQHVLSLEPNGCAVEFGVEKGVSLRLIANRMPVVGFDAFQGLPEDWRPGYGKGSLKAKPPSPIRNARIVEGWFADTLPLFDFGVLEPIGLVHFDADLYSSTATALRHVGPHLRSGCYIVFDEWFGYDGAERHEQRAWREYIVDNPLDWDVVGSGVQTWAIRIR